MSVFFITTYCHLMPRVRTQKLFWHTGEAIFLPKIGIFIEYCKFCGDYLACSPQICGE